jgi:glycerophosphoryl diester phosphodiesterase
MKPLYVKVFFYEPPLNTDGNPAPERTYPVSNGIAVEVVEINSFNPDVGFDALALSPHPSDASVFYVENAGYSVSSSHYIRIGFINPNFASQGLFGGNATAPRVLHPARVPYWDTGWKNDYGKNEYFGSDLLVDSSLANPLKLYVPLREFFVLSHHGASDYYPENTIASYGKALDLGANGIEIDICPTKDMKIVCYHNISPLNIISVGHDLSMKYNLQSPHMELLDDGRLQVHLWNWDGAQFIDKGTAIMASSDEFDIPNLTFEQFRMAYHYELAEKVYCEIPLLEEFLAFAHENESRLDFVFVDVKDPGWGIDKNRYQYIQYGKALGTLLLGYPDVQPMVVVCNPDAAILEAMREGIHAAGVTACSFGYDATGLSIPSAFDKDHATEIVLQNGFDVVSIGTTLRLGSLAEIIAAVRSRDYSPSTTVRKTVYWTINDASTFIDTFRIGVNCIITDKPDEMIKMLKRLKVVLS